MMNSITRTSSGRELESSSTPTSGAGFVACCTMRRRLIRVSVFVIHRVGGGNESIDFRGSLSEGFLKVLSSFHQVGTQISKGWKVFLSTANHRFL
jgi:hypothetical protein